MVTALLYGLYYAGVSIALTLIGYFTGMDRSDSSSWMSWLGIPFLILFLWLAMKERKREDYGGTITYGQCVGTGVLVGVFAGIVMAIFMYVYLTAINPGFMEFILDKQAKAVKESGAENAQKSMEMMRNFALPFTVGASLIGSIAFATVISLIVAIFVRTKPEDAAVKTV
jgi:uncharacterized membrane protein YhfC